MSKGEQTRQQIISQATVLASQGGLQQLSLSVLAESLDISKSGLFAHFKSKEALELAVVEEATARFAGVVVMPALSKPRGLPRLRHLFECNLEWVKGITGMSGCIFMSLSHEYDGKPGAVRDALVQSQRDWRLTIGRVAKTAAETGELHQSLDTALFAFEFEGIAMAFQRSLKLLGDRHALSHARSAFESLLHRSQIDQF
jgi:AcrR family transcriptional regulator